MKISRIAAAAVLAFVAASAGASAATISDGDFSSPNLAGGWADVSVPGWQNDNGDALEVGNTTIYGLPTYPGTSGQLLEVNANAFDTVSATVSGLTIGTTYDLSWAYGGRPGGGPQALNISFGDAPVAGSSLLQDTGSLGSWTLNNLDVVADASTEYLTFASVDEGGLPSYGNELTAVSVSAVPLPGALLLFGSALLGMAGFSRRKSRKAQMSKAA